MDQCPNLLFHSHLINVSDAIYSIPFHPSAFFPPPVNTHGLRAHLTNAGVLFLSLVKHIQLLDIVFDSCSESHVSHNHCRQAVILPCPLPPLSLHNLWFALASDSQQWWDTPGFGVGVQSQHDE